MGVYEAVTSGKYDTVSDLDLPVTTLMLLAPKSVPPEAVEAVGKRTRANAGRKVSKAEVEKIVGEVKATKKGETSGRTTNKIAA
jgi:hypothetical protein